MQTLKESVLLTGSGGMLGSNIQKVANALGIELICLTRSLLDLRNRNDVLAFLGDFRIKTVIHCAAKVGGIQANVDEQSEFIMENLLIDTSIISAARQHKIENLIYFGSSCMYPKNCLQPMTEELLLSSSLEPTNEGYALAKLVSAKAIAAIANSDNLNWKVLVPSNLYGTHDNFDLYSSHLVPAIIHKTIDAINSNSNTIEIWGDGMARREFTYAGDVAEFVINNLENMKGWKPIMNIGFGVDYSINDYYKMIAKILKFQGTFTYDSRKPSGMSRKLLDSSKAKECGWKPSTDFEKGLRSTIQWYLAQK